MNDKCKNILHLPHKQSDTRPHMSVSDRAAQFAPFTALTGYDSAIQETARLTDRKRELSETELDELDRKLNYIVEHLDQPFSVTIAYFWADKRKSGCKYFDYTGFMKKIDEYEQTVTMQSSDEIFILDISDIESPVFDSPPAIYRKHERPFHG